MTTEQRMKKLSIEYIESYTDITCNVTGNVGVIKYYEHCNHGFNSAYQSGGLFDWLEAAEALAKEKHPGCVVRLSMPDCVFTY